MRKLFVYLSLFVATAFFLSLATAETNSTVFLGDGDCVDAQIERLVTNSTTNTSQVMLVNTTICSNSLTNSFCAVSKELTPGEIYEKEDSACRLQFECQVNTSIVKHTIPIFVEGQAGDSGNIRVSIGDDIKNFPREAGYFNYETEYEVECPVFHADNLAPEGEDPKAIATCLEILKDKNNNATEVSTQLVTCQNERDNFKVEWETRGREVETLNQQVGTCNEQVASCEEDVSSTETSFWIMFAFLLAFAVPTTIVVIRNKLMGGSSLG